MPFSNIVIEKLAVSRFP